jgi:hypothetical protein
MEKNRGNRKNSNYDMLGIFVQLCFNMGLKLEEMHTNNEELVEHVEKLSEKISLLDKELQAFRDCLKSE